MKHKGIAFLVTVVMLLTMIPVVAFATVDDLNLTAPASPVYMRSNTSGTVPVTFTSNASNNSDVSARISLMQGSSEISYVVQTLDLDDRSWTGTINLPVNSGTLEGSYDIRISLTQGSTHSETFDDKVIIDNTAPTSTITDPSNMEELDTNDSVVIRGGASDADITGTSIDGSGVAGVAVLITGPDGYSRTPDVDGDTDWDADWTTPTTPGAYVIAARATDEAGNVQSTATTITVYVGMDAPDTYTLTMAATTGGTSSAITVGPYVSGAAVSISASANSGYEFTGWTASKGSFANDEDPTTTFTMPNDDITVTAHFSLKGTDDDGEDEDTVAYKAAPAIAAEILKANGISPNEKKTKGEKGEKGMNYISAVAKMMGNGASFDGVEKSDYEDYYDAVLDYLEEITDKSLEDPRD